MRHIGDLISKCFSETPDKSKCKTLLVEGGKYECFTFGSCPYATYSGDTKYCNNSSAESFVKTA